MFGGNSKKDNVTKLAVEELTHDDVMGDITQTHERLIAVDLQNKDKLDKLRIERGQALAKFDSEIAALEEEQVKIERSKKFFSAFAAGKDAPEDE